MSDHSTSSPRRSSKHTHTHIHTMKLSSRHTRTEEKNSTDFILDGQPEKRGVQKEIWRCGSDYTHCNVFVCLRGCVCCACSSVFTILDFILIWRDSNLKLSSSITFTNKCFIHKQNESKLIDSSRTELSVRLSLTLIIHSKISPIISVFLTTLVHGGSKEGKGAGPFRAATMLLVGLRSKAGKKIKCQSVNCTCDCFEN